MSTQKHGARTKAEQLIEAFEQNTAVLQIVSAQLAETTEQIRNAPAPAPIDINAIAEAVEARSARGLGNRTVVGRFYLGDAARVG